MKDKAISPTCWIFTKLMMTWDVEDLAEVMDTSTINSFPSGTHIYIHTTRHIHQQLRNYL